MEKYISAVDCSNYSTVKLFQGMLDELSRKMGKSQYEYFLTYIVEIKEQEINDLELRSDHFRKLIDYYLKYKDLPERPPEDEIKLIN